MPINPCKFKVQKSGTAIFARKQSTCGNDHSRQISLDTHTHWALISHYQATVCHHQAITKPLFGNCQAITELPPRTGRHHQTITKLPLATTKTLPSPLWELPNHYLSIMLNTYYKHDGKYISKKASLIPTLFEILDEKRLFVVTNGQKMFNKLK